MFRLEGKPLKSRIQVNGFHDSDPNRAITFFNRITPGIIQSLARHAFNQFVQRIIITPHYDGGFFSNFNKVINILVHRQQYPNLKSVEVDWSIESVEGSHFSFGRPEDGNLWLHLFEPPPFPRKRVCLTCRTYKYMDLSITGLKAYSLYHGDPSWRVRYNRAYKEYIRLRPHIRRRVETFYDEHMAGRHCIGFHVRNALHRSEMPGNVMPGIQDFVDKANAIIRGGNSKPVVFLATDVAEVVETFSSRVQAEVLVQPGVERESQASGRELHRGHPRPSIKLAEDVLIDCLLLAKCNVFVHITSNIATAVGYINPNLTMIYLE